MPTQFIHGNQGMVVINPTNTVGGGVVVTEAISWRFEIDTDLVDSSDFSGVWKAWTPTPTGWHGAFEGRVRKDSNLMWTIQQSGLQVFPTVNKSALPFMCLYPDRTNTSHFYSGQIWPKLSVDVRKKNVQNFTMDFTGEGALFQQ